MVKQGRIEWLAVESSNLARIGIGIEEADKGKVELYVEFKGGTQYVYHDVPGATGQGLLDADSKGKYLNEHIKGQFNFNKLG